MDESEEEEIQIRNPHEIKFGSNLENIWLEEV